MFNYYLTSALIETQIKALLEEGITFLEGEPERIEVSQHNGILTAHIVTEYEEDGQWYRYNELLFEYDLIKNTGIQGRDILVYMSKRTYYQLEKTLIEISRKGL